MGRVKSMIALSIVVPTYDRCHSLERQLQALSSLGAFDDPRIEVIVGNNASKDGTKRLLGRQKKKYGAGFKPINYQNHVGTAEENIARVAGCASGTYIWLLSDDDVIVRPAFYYLKELALQARADCYIFDNASPQLASEECVNAESHTVDLALPGVLVKLQKTGEIEYEEFVRKFGVTSYGALISRYLIRRELLIGAIERYIDVSVIYSHVFAFLERFMGKRVEFVSCALIWRRESPVHDRFEKLADKSYGYMLYPWTSGLVSLAREFERRHGRELGWLGGVCEIRGDGSTYAVIEEIFNQLCRQIIFSAHRMSSVQLMCARDFSDVSEYLRACGVHPHHLRALSVLNMELRVQLKRYGMYGRHVVDGHAITAITDLANELICLPDDQKYLYKYASGHLLWRKIAVVCDYYWSVLRDKNPRLHVLMSRSIFNGVIARLGVVRFAQWLKRIAI